jgi:DNA-binding PadR family transcriptional regulator
MWILDSSSGIRKISPIQMAILLECAKVSPDPLKITDIMTTLKATFPSDSWEPKKGTIYPAVHHLDVRGYLKLQVISPKGYVITEKGFEVINSMIAQFGKQMELYMIYYKFILENYSAVDSERANTIRENVLNSTKEFLKKFK